MLFILGENSVRSVLILLIPTSLFLSPVLTTVLVPCAEHNEICIAVQSCSKFKAYAQVDFRHWPEEIRKKKCNQVDGSQIPSVCCPTVLNMKGCGKSHQDRISGGNAAELYQFPWMARLQYKHTQMFCGGTLISWQYVITAAHCLKDVPLYIPLTNISVILGELDVRNETDCNYYTDEEPDCAPEPQHIGIRKLIKHPKYGRSKNDIALVRLERPATPNYNVKPICLHGGTMEQQIKDNPNNFTVSGWGTTASGNESHVLNYASVHLVPLDECNRQIQLDSFNPYFSVNQSYICAKGKPGVNHCTGDSGGPLLYASHFTMSSTLVGIVNFGHIGNCVAQKLPGVSANVTNYLSWIVENVKSSSTETPLSTTTTTDAATITARTTTATTEAVETTAPTTTTTEQITTTTTTTTITAINTTTTTEATTTISNITTTKPSDGFELSTDVLLPILVIVCVFGAIIIGCFTAQMLKTRRHYEPEVNGSGPETGEHLLKVDNSCDSERLDVLGKGIVSIELKSV